MTISKSNCGHLDNGEELVLYTMDNGMMSVSVLNYGGIVTSLSVPDRQGILDDVVLGYENIEDYLTQKSYFGCIVGRYANRINNGRFSIDGDDFILGLNEGENHLHGGYHGFDKKVWEVSTEIRNHSLALILTYRSTDGEEGYPGNVDSKVIYKLKSGETALSIEYEATTDRKTPINLTHHSYFNLSGQNDGSILNHELSLNASQYTPVCSAGIPTGEILDVAGTPFDFRDSCTIGSRIHQDHPQLHHGYDHNWILNRAEVLGELFEAATLYDPRSGRSMKVLTDQPAIQFYSGNFLGDGIKGKEGRVYRKYEGLCLETQLYPDSPNNSLFPNSILHPNEKYTHHCIYQFFTHTN